MNKWFGIGRLGKDVDIRYTQSGKAVASFSLAIDDGYGEKRKTYWLNIVTWDKLAQTCADNLAKGSKVAIEGKLTNRQYESNGQKRTAWDIVAQSVDFLDSKGQGQQSQERPKLSQDDWTESIPF